MSAILISVEKFPLRVLTDVSDLLIICLANLTVSKNIDTEYFIYYIFTFQRWEIALLWTGTVLYYVLYYTVLYYVLYCTLYCIVLCTLLHYVLYCIMYCIVLCTVLYFIYFTLLYFTMYFTVPYCTIYCTVLYYVVSHFKAWPHLFWV